MMGASEGSTRARRRATQCCCCPLGPLTRGLIVPTSLATADAACGDDA